MLLHQGGFVFGMRLTLLESGDIICIMYKRKERTIMTEIFGCRAAKLEGNAHPQELTDAYIDIYEKCRNSGYTPVIVAWSELLEETIEDNYGEYGRPEDFRHAVLSADTTNGKAIFEKYFDQIKAMLEDSGEEVTGRGGHCFTAGNALAYREGCVLYMVYVPTEKPWEIFAWLPFGGWNDCPDTQDMLSMSRYWYETYGAVPAFLTSDMLEFYLPEPIEDKETAREIAREHCAFCSDVLVMGGISPVASEILHADVWSFWWD